MKRPMTRLAAAAVIAVVGVVGVALWTGTQAPIALAEVLARVEQARAFRCRGEFTMTGESAPGRPYRMEMRGTVLASQEWGRRTSREQVDPNGTIRPVGETYFLPGKKTVVSIDHLPKVVTRTELEEAEVQRMQDDLAQDADPAWFLREIMKCRYEGLGRSTVEGMDVEGFRTTDANCSIAAGLTDPQVDAKLWVDTKTRLPVRVEALASGLAGGVSRMSNRILLHDFQWDVAAAEDAFEPPALPEGYLLVVDRVPGPVTEEGVVQGLRQCAELLGRYPGSIGIAPPRGIQSELDQSDSPAATQLKEELKGLAEQDRMDRLMEAGTPLRRVHRFFMGLFRGGKDVAYHGRAVRPQDTDKVLMRWKVSESEYCVLFGDLHAETLPPERLAELEKGLAR